VTDFYSRLYDFDHGNGTYSNQLDLTVVFITRKCLQLLFLQKKNIAITDSCRCENRSLLQINRYK